MDIDCNHETQCWGNPLYFEQHPRSGLLKTDTSAVFLKATVGSVKIRGKEILRGGGLVHITCVGRANELSQKEKKINEA